MEWGGGSYLTDGGEFRMQVSEDLFVPAGIRGQGSGEIVQQMSHTHRTIT